MLLSGAEPPVTRAAFGRMESAEANHMESGGGIPLPEALGEAVESPQHPLSPRGEGAAGSGELDGSAQSAEGEGEGAPRRLLRVVYVCSDSFQCGAPGTPEVGAQQCLLLACEAEGAHLSIVSFGKLDFGETAVLDAFYNAGEAVPRLPQSHSCRLSFSSQSAWRQSLPILAPPAVFDDPGKGESR